MSRFKPPIQTTLPSVSFEISGWWHDGDTLDRLPVEATKRLEIPAQLMGRTQMARVMKEQDGNRMRQVWTWPRVELSDGAVEAMKWLGLILMTADHAQKYGLMPAVPGVYEAGRLAFPLFGIVLAYNLARVHNRDRAVYVRVLTRLLVCGLVAAQLHGGTLAVVVCIMYVIESRRPFWKTRAAARCFSWVGRHMSVKEGGPPDSTALSHVPVISSVGGRRSYSYSWLFQSRIHLSRRPSLLPLVSPHKISYPLG